MRYLTLSKLTEAGRRRYPEAKDLFAKVNEIVEEHHGKFHEVFAMSSVYDFVAISDYPTAEDAFAARVKLSELDVITIEAYEIFDMDLFFASV